MHHILIGTGPFIVNTLVGAIVATPFSLSSYRGSVGSYICLWLGISIAMHSFPSTGDAKTLWRGLWSKGMPLIARFASVPLVLLIYLGALGSFFWLDLIYGITVAWWVPKAAISLAGLV